MHPQSATSQILAGLLFSELRLQSASADHPGRGYCQKFAALTKHAAKLNPFMKCRQETKVSAQKS
jgi:hypothetical protein